MTGPVYFGPAYWGLVYWGGFIPTGAPLPGHHYFGQAYWGGNYWGIPSGTIPNDCSGGPYVVTGYWIYGYAECDILPQTATIGVTYGPIRWSWPSPRPQPARRRHDDSAERRARREAWDAIAEARNEDALRARPIRAPRKSRTPQVIPPAITIAEIAAQAQAERSPAKRNAMLALLLILNEA